MLYIYSWLLQSPTYPEGPLLHSAVATYCHRVAVRVNGLHFHRLYHTHYMSDEVCVLEGDVTYTMETSKPVLCSRWVRWLLQVKKPASMIQDNIFINLLTHLGKPTKENKYVFEAKTNAWITLYVTVDWFQVIAMIKQALSVVMAWECCWSLLLKPV